MKLVSIDHSGFPAVAVMNEQGDAVLPVSTAALEHGASAPISMSDLLEDWSFWRDRLGSLSANSVPRDWLPIDSVRIIAPVPHPRTLICIGLNYRDHALETGAAIPAEPIVFAKHTSSVIASNDSIVIPESSQAVDYEAELAIVIGADVYDVTPEQGLAAVAGYTILNDVSARDWQGRTSQWMPAKSFPTFGPMGPVLVTADEFGDGRGRRISLTVNGRVLQDSSTDELIFGVGEIVSYLSRVWPLSSGDVIATGTPAGVGFTRTPPVYLGAGDVVEVSIEGIGVLRNPVVASADRGVLAR